MYFDDYWHVELEMYQKTIYMLFSYQTLYIKTHQYSSISYERQTVPKLTQNYFKFAFAQAFGAHIQGKPKNRTVFNSSPVYVDIE